MYNVIGVDQCMILYNCENIALLKTLLFSKSILQIIFTLIPIALIVFVTIDIVKIIIGKDDDFKKIPVMILKRFVAAVILFFIPFLVTLLLTKVGEINDNKLVCYDDATTENIQRLEQKEADDIISKMNINEIKLADINKLYKAISKISDKSVKEDYQKRLKEIKEKYNQQQQSKIVEQEKEKTSVKVKKNNYSKTLYVGDSRTVGMCNSVNLTKDEDCTIAEDSREYNWFANNALAKIKSKLSKDQKYNVVISMGTNDLGLISNAKKYASKYNELKKNYPSANIIAVAVGPIIDANVTYMPQVVNNSNVVKFNNMLKNNLSTDVKYCDIYSEIKDSFNASDGVHYDNNTYRNIYEVIKKCL